MARFKALLPTTLLLAGIELVGRSECTTSSLTWPFVHRTGHLRTERR